ncbi:hypothetical protein M5689_022338 [Euphorbia peplus]|nr:hypothetical protein M5689_022338 [Euphorbia peplus]
MHLHSQSHIQRRSTRLQNRRKRKRNGPNTSKSHKGVNFESFLQRALNAVTPNDCRVEKRVWGIDVVEDGMRVRFHGDVEIGEGADEFGDEIAALVETVDENVGVDLFDLGEDDASVEDRDNVGFEETSLVLKLRKGFENWGMGRERLRLRWLFGWIVRDQTWSS